MAGSDVAFIALGDQGYWVADRLTDRRGDPWEHDPGPPRNRRWRRLFAETPNYRGIGVAYTGQEEFRWHQGSMFYRGRLGDRQVKVLVVGQEGAQDESLSHRSFTGGTGARMQHVLNHIGIDRSYLFLNTFVYPIFGQYNGKLPDSLNTPNHPSPTSQRALEYALARNDIRLVIAVGNAAKESIATWIRTRGGRANPGSLHTADHHVLGSRVRALGMLHPGSQSADLERKFRTEVRRIERWESDSPGWLPTDRGMDRQPASDYTYSSAPIPFRDFAYGTNWRLGRGGTSSNRSSNQQSIQVFGQRGRYNNRDVRYPRPPSSSWQDPGDVTPPGDLAYEPPRSDADAYDRGPGSCSPGFCREGGSTGRPWPDFAALGLGVDAAFGAGPTHRGILGRGQLVLVAGQQSVDDLFTGRALCGDVGQHLQSLLRAVGLTRSYSIIRTLPVHTLGERPAERRRGHRRPHGARHPPRRCCAGSHPPSRDPRRRRRAGGRRRSTARHPDRQPRPVRRERPRPGVASGREPAEDDGLPEGHRRSLASLREQQRADPRQDLPFGTLRWQATTGDRAQQGRVGGRLSPDYFRVSMPIWASRLARLR